MTELERRREFSRVRLAELKQRLPRTAELTAGKACVYATGSYGRREAGENSDLDLFIAGRMAGEGESEPKRLLRRLNEVRVKAELIDVTEELQLPEFDGDGEYLRHYGISELIDTLGTPQDDSLNTFTARLLLLLESTPLVGDEVYDEALNAVLAAYWGDYEGHEHEFMPTFLANDILRLWRTFCVN